MSKDAPHPLLEGSLTRRLTALNECTDEDVREAFKRRVFEICNAYDTAFNNLFEVYDQQISEARRRIRARMDKVTEEYQALHDMVDADYRKLLDPLAEYVDTIAAERVRVLNALADAWNAAVEEEKRGATLLQEATKGEMRKFRDTLFREGKQAINAALEEVREEMRQRANGRSAS
jgi:hypothetical protein